MENNTTSNNIITRAIDFYSWTMTISGKSSYKINLILNRINKNVQLNGNFFGAYIKAKFMRSEKE